MPDAKKIIMDLIKGKAFEGVTAMKGLSEPSKEIVMLRVIKNVGGVHQKLRFMTKKISPDYLNNLTTKHRNPDKGFKLLSNWSSTSCGSTFRQFNIAENTTFFNELFTSVQAQVLSLMDIRENGHELNRRDLFHGHIIFYQHLTHRDILIVFHAKEYPSDLEEFKSGVCDKLKEGKEFKGKTDKAYPRRNSIWALGPNTLWNISIPRNPTARYALFPLLTPRPGGVPYDPLVVNQDRLGDKIADLNYFPDEGVDTFLATKE